MLHINDDSDELFRKAAEHYPLNTGQGDWEGLRKKMDEGITETPATLPPNRNRQGWFFLVLAGLLLIAPLAIMDNYLKKHNKATASLAGPGSTNKAAGKMELPSTGPITGEQSSLPALPPPVPTNASAIPDQDAVPYYNQTQAQSGFIPMISTNKANIKDDPAGNEPRKKKFTDKEKMKLAITAAGQEEPAVDAESAREQLPVAKTNADPAPTVTAPAPVAKTVVTITAENKKEKEQAKPKKTKVRHFYAGLIVGPDLSMVKFQSAKKIGYSAGIVAGYKLNSRWGLETGLLWDRKAYYTDGKYFSTKNIPLPNYTTIREADGVCRMFEIPLNIRYSFKIKPNSNWFVSAGSSSYIMKKETYDYEVKRYNNIYYGSAEYRNSGSGIFSVINASAGYQMKLGSIGDIRFEPYIKIPVGKVGIGNLPLQSGGILVGLTKTF